MNLNERINQVWTKDYNAMGATGKEARLMHQQVVKNLIRDVLREVTPSQITQAEDFDFTLHDDDPAGNNAYAYNCAVDDMKRAAKELGLEL